MPLPQPGIFALGTNSHAYLEFDLAAGADQRDAVRVAAGLREPRTTIGGVNLVTGFRPELWESVAPNAAPSGVRSFETPVAGSGLDMPATQHDIVM
jgi:putative iron-dependent peroxidase